MPKLKPGTIMPTPEEDAAITAAALSDPDNPPLTDEFFKNMRPVKSLGRPVSERPKTSISLRIDPEVLDYYKAAGKGWQSRINQILADYSRTHKG